MLRMVRLIFPAFILALFIAKIFANPINPALPAPDRWDTSPAPGPLGTLEGHLLLAAKLSSSHEGADSEDLGASAADAQVSFLLERVNVIWLCVLSLLYFFISPSHDKTKDAALSHLRSVAKAYVAIVPGAGYIINIAFDSLEEVSELYRDEANNIVLEAAEEMRKLLKGAPLDVTTAHKVLRIFQKRGDQLSALASKAGGDFLEPFIERGVNGAQEKARGVFQDTAEQVRRIFSGGYSQENIDKAKSPVSEKTTKVKSLVESNEDQNSGSVKGI
ncbi:uncharacterized protein EI90DRAFT_3121971 [Cantharellus anzutake]|uniref:uncharacterized protein n=1 Tax=Cantharellus anzutake TaxID=1750568 RepID=UPI0019088573|nr:uncharacterized protein EI90DRAFT_3121971 [Cantharellus anzutake]KAF8333624.1 hypothetical protein EI90DRAFT_3121971 [Cantharellus anzutake]